MRNEDVLQRPKEDRNVLQTIKGRKAKLFFHVLRRICLLKHVVEGRREVKGREGKRSKQLLDDLKETRGHRKLINEALDHTLWRTCVGTDCGPVAKQTAK